MSWCDIFWRKSIVSSAQLQKLLEASFVNLFIVYQNHIKRALYSFSNLTSVHIQ